MSDSSVPMKVCSLCQVAKPATPEVFDRQARGAGGLAARCKRCTSIDRKRTREGGLPITHIQKKLALVAPETFTDSPDERRIPLRGKWGVGKYALVDATDFEALMREAWHISPEGYAGLRDWTRSETSMARIIMNAEKGVYVDHINRNRLDNRRCNLRIATSAQNSANKVMVKRPSSTGYRGVKRAASISVRFYARIAVEGKIYNLGNYDTPEEAGRAYDAAAIKAHGDFAVLNFPVK